MIKRNSISSIRRKTHRNVDRVIDKAESTVELGKEKIEHLKNNVDGYIQKNPEKNNLKGQPVSSR